MSKKGKVLRHYVSPLDQFLAEFDKEHPGLSKSQKHEVNKYRRIYRLRDDAKPSFSPTNLPEDF